ncbi:N-acyl-D-amino-acid deacylase family protein [Sphingosinicella rhizophila]|uniref:D-aminoacylase n=1 Tax=Sphingosinicella rhizophila TaxID=3050082 RepID=A0ABU3QBS4_9SPHN|nr:D-aminoacylase [Sphingosinicella sp. GR2756]MDT9600604.1 D-aminoacylase [Sphingosinicella sp. GR2756]
MMGKSGFRTILAATVAAVAIGFASPGTATLAQPAASSVAQAADVVVRGGTIYDGSGGAPYRGDVVIRGDKIIEVVKGRFPGRGAREIDATGLAVAPGFINMLSWATESLIVDGRAMSDIKQGVTLEVFGEGSSMGPMSPEMKRLAVQRQGDIKYPIEWTSFGEYLDYLVKKGVSPNVASFIGTATIRQHELGEGDVDPDTAQLQRMRALVRQGMEEGAMGVGSSLIYAPGTYAETPELIALATESAKCGGMYISHMRSEGTKLVEAVDELIEISRASGGPAEIYHLKQGGRDNWHKLDAVIERVEAARAKGQRITADMYTYIAGSTGLDAAMPTWVQAGGYEAWAKRLQDPATRAKVMAEMKTPGDGWENLAYAAGGPDKVLLVGFKNDDLKKYTGKALAEVARIRGKTPEETAMDLVIEDGSRVQVVYFMMSEDNVKRQIKLPWVSFDSDAEAPAAEGVFLKSMTHPRAYGNFARLLGKYVRDEKVISLPEAIRKLTSLPAENLSLRQRGSLKPGYFADLAIFDPAKIQDHATFEKPHQYATGMRFVLVNGVEVLRDGEATDARPGQVVRGPGWTGWPDGGACKE